MYGQKQWALLARKLRTDYGIKGRTGKQCRERWHNHLDPHVIKNEWTLLEEATLFEAQRKHGNKWSEIAEHLPGRTDNAIKNHFYSTLRKELRKLNKTRPITDKLSMNDLLLNQNIGELLITITNKKSVKERMSSRLRKSADEMTVEVKKCEEVDIDDYLDDWDSEVKSLKKKKPDPLFLSNLVDPGASRSSSKSNPMRHAFLYNDEVLETLEYRDICQTDESEVGMALEEGFFNVI